MTQQPYVMPPRDWGDDEPEPVELPIIIVSSRDGAAVPRVGACVRLEAAAVALGWTVTQTYALASIPARPRKAAHMLATVCVRMDRLVDGSHRHAIGCWPPATGPVRQFGFAMWSNEDDHGWRFHHAFVDGAMVGARSIVDALK